MTVLIPLRLRSAANLHEQWWARAKRVKAERAAVTMVLGGGPRPPFPVVVTLVRIAPRMLDSHDNLTGAFKATADAIAAWLGTPDNDPRIRWEYAQRKGAPREYGVEISIESPRVEVEVGGIVGVGG